MLNQQVYQVFVSKKGTNFSTQYLTFRQVSHIDVAIARTESAHETRSRVTLVNSMPYDITFGIFFTSNLWKDSTFLAVEKKEGPRK